MFEVSDAIAVLVIWDHRVGNVGGYYSMRAWTGVRWRERTMPVAKPMPDGLGSGVLMNCQKVLRCSIEINPYPEALRTHI